MKLSFKNQILNGLTIFLLAGMLLSVTSCSPRYGCYTGATETTKQIFFEDENCPKPIASVLATGCGE